VHLFRIVTHGPAAEKQIAKNASDYILDSCVAKPCGGEALRHEFRVSPSTERKSFQTVFLVFQTHNVTTHDVFENSVKINFLLVTNILSIWFFSKNSGVKTKHQLDAHKFFIYKYT
jgi:hypothetical protein